jgi:hypothetical protein
MDRFTIFQFCLLLLAVPLQYFIVTKWSSKDIEQAQAINKYIRRNTLYIFRNFAFCSEFQIKSIKSFIIYRQIRGLIGLLVFLLKFHLDLILFYINVYGDVELNLLLQKFIILEKNMDILLVIFCFCCYGL